MDALWKGLLALFGIGVGVLVTAGAGRRVGEILDRRKQAQLSEKAAPHTKKRTTKPWALVLHQMGFSRGNNPAAYDKTTAHYKILPDGTIMWSWNDDVRLPAAGALNEGSWSVEFAGNLPSQPGSRDPDRYYKPTRFGMDQLTVAQVEAGRDLIDHLIDRGLTTVLAHRQGGEERQNDPGPDIWYRVAEWGIRKRNLKWGGPDFSVGGGQPIPAWWRTWGDQLGGLDGPIV